MDYTQLIVLVLQAVAQYGPELVQSVKNLITANPQQQGETDAAYIARIQAQIDTEAADTTAADQSVIGAPATTTQPPATTTSTPATTTAPPGGIINVS